ATAGVASDDEGDGEPLMVELLGAIPVAGFLGDEGQLEEQDALAAPVASGTEQRQPRQPLIALVVHLATPRARICRQIAAARHSSPLLARRNTHHAHGAARLS